MKLVGSPVITTMTLSAEAMNVDEDSAPAPTSINMKSGLPLISLNF